MAKEFQNFSVKGGFDSDISIINPINSFLNPTLISKPCLFDSRFDCQNLLLASRPILVVIRS